MNWDDVRFVLALARAGTLAAAAETLGVDHTTVGRRIAAAESALGLRLFLRSPLGYRATADAERLLGAFRAVEEAVLGVERAAQASHTVLDGNVRVTSPESLGVAYLAGRLAHFGVQHPALRVELVAAGRVLDLSRREAEVAVRAFRSREASLVTRRVAEMGYGVYASHAYLDRAPFDRKALASHRWLSTSVDVEDVESRWLRRLAPSVRPAFVSELSVSLVAAACAGAGMAILPRFLGDREAALQRIILPHEPSESLWITVHRDLRQTPRVRALVEHLVRSFADDAALLAGATR